MKINQTSRWRMNEDIPTTRCKGSKQVWSKIWEQKEHNRKAKWINNSGKEFQGLEKALKQKYNSIHLEKHSRKYQIGLHGFLFEKFTNIFDRLNLKINRCFEETDISEWITKGKTTLIEKDPHQKKETTPNNYWSRNRRSTIHESRHTRGE